MSREIYKDTQKCDLFWEAVSGEHVGNHKQRDDELGLVGCEALKEPSHGEGG